MRHEAPTPKPVRLCRHNGGGSHPMTGQQAQRSAGFSGPGQAGLPGERAQFLLVWRGRLDLAELKLHRKAHVRTALHCVAPVGSGIRREWLHAAYLHFGLFLELSKHTKGKPVTAELKKEPFSPPWPLNPES
jgi:hypothetical protein